MTKYTILTVCGLILVGSLLLNILFREVDFLKDVKLIKEVNANSKIEIDSHYFDLNGKIESIVATG